MSMSTILHAQVTMPQKLKKRGTVNWEAYMPSPCPQTQNFLPKSWSGACAPAACGDAFTARMRKANPNHDFNVDREAFVHSAVGRGVLVERGSSPYWLGRLVKFSGMPLRGNIPRANGMHLKPDRPAYALGMHIESYRAVTLPPCRPTTPAEYDDALRCRENLCDQVDEGPIVVSFYHQKHWATPRPDHEPYRPLPGLDHYQMQQLSDGKVVPVGHCVTVYGYTCPEGDVRSLILYCQDNMIGTPGRLRMSPDAVDAYFVPIVDNFMIAQDPLPGNELTEELRVAQVALEPAFLDWDKLVTETCYIFSSPALSNKVPSMANCHVSLTTNNGQWKDLEFKVCYYGAQGQHIGKGYVPPIVKNHIYPTPTLSYKFPRYDASLATSYMETSEIVDLDWGNLGFGIIQTDYECVAKCGSDEIFSKGEVKPFGPITRSPCAARVLNYGQGLFEGLKAFTRTDGSILLSRPEVAITRMRNGVERMCVAAPYQFVDAVHVLANKRWYRVTAQKFAKEKGYFDVPYLDYFEEVSLCNIIGKGLCSVNLIVQDQFHHASLGGTGGVKPIGNYASVLEVQNITKEKGYSGVLYLDVVHNKYLQEVSLCNYFSVKGNIMSVPATKGTILPCITRNSIIEVAQSKGFKVTEHLISVHELLDADEVLCTGTAVVVSPLGNITYLEKRVEYGKQGVNVVSWLLYKSLTGLLMGGLEDGMDWIGPCYSRPHALRT